MLFDLHNDFPTRFFNADYFRHICNGTTRVTAVIWTSDIFRSTERAVDNIYRRLVKTAPMPIAIEDIGFLASNDAYRRFDFSPYFYCSLTWNYNNGFAGGALDDGQLTVRGKRVIKTMENSGCYVDLSHLNKQSFYQVLDRAKNVLCSHTGFNTHPRSLDDNQIKALITRNAVIGLCAVRAFTDVYSAADLADVIDAFVQKYGCDCLAFGTDFNGSDDIPDEINNYDKLNDIKNILSGRGYADIAINKIFYENANAIYEKNKI